MKRKGWQSSLWCIFGKFLTDAEGEDDQADSSLSLSPLKVNPSHQFAYLSLTLFS